MLLSLLLCLGLLPASALAASSSGSLTSTASKQVVMLGTGSPLGFDSKVGYNGTYDKLYFGTYYADMTSEDAVGRPHLWRILDGETSDPTNPDGLFLLSTDGYDRVRFTLPRADESTESWWLQPHNDWSSSLCAARLWCGEMAKSAKVFSDAERGALLAVSKASERYQPTSTSYFKQLYGSVKTGALTNEKIFYLSAKEFEDSRYGLTENGGEIGVYPLRSAADGASYDSDAGKINDGMIASGSNRVDVLPTYTKLLIGSSYSEELTATEKFFFDGIMDFSFFPDLGATEEYVCEYNGYTAHPAMNLSGEKLLYITAADNSGHQSYGTLADDSDNWEWKAVLTDSNTAFKSQVALTNAPANNLFDKNGYTLTVSHPALSTLSDYDVITASLSDGEGKLIRYGAIGAEQDATSTDVEIPAGLADGVYTLRITAEKRNAEKCSDVAAQPFVAEIKVASAHNHPVCGIANCTDAALGEHSSVSWTPVTTTAELAAMDKDGYYFLIGNVAAPTTACVGHLCVNGYTVTGVLKAGLATDSEGNAVSGLTLCGCKGKTEIAEVVVADGAVFDLYGLSVSALTVGNGSTLNMHSGSNGKGGTTSSYACTKAETYISEGAKLNLYGGTLSTGGGAGTYVVLLAGCEAHVYKGGTLSSAGLPFANTSITVHEGGYLGPTYLEETSTLTVMDGGYIECASAQENNTINLYRCTIIDPNVSGGRDTIESKGTVNLYGAVSGGHFKVDKPLNICEDLGDAPSRIPTICMNNYSNNTQTWVKNAFTSGWTAKMGSADATKYFQPDVFGYEAKADATSGELHCTKAAHGHPICGLTCTHTGSGAHQNVSWTDVSAWSSFDFSGGNYCLMKTVKNPTKGGTISVSGNVTICLDGFTLNLNEACFDLQSGATLTICDCKGGGSTGKISGGKGDKGRAINVPQGAALVLYGGELSGNDPAATLADNAKGGAVRVKGGTFTMYGGTISEGVAVEVVSGSFYFKGGTLESLWAEGAAFWQTGGTISMTGGASDAYVPLSMTGGEFTMSGGSMNSGIYPASISGGTFKISGGTLTASQKALEITGSGTVNLTGGSVTCINGAAVTIDGGTFNMSGGTVGYQENRYENRAAGVTLTSGAFKMSGGEIKGRNPGVAVNGGTMTVSGTAKIVDNGPILYGRVYPKNVVLASGQKLAVGTMSSGAEIGITMADKTGVFSTGGKDYPTSFSSDDPDYTVSASGSDLQLGGTAAPAPTVTKLLINGEKVEAGSIVNLEVGKTLQLSAVLSPADAEYWWYLSDGKRTELDAASGTVTGVKAHSEFGKDTHCLVYDRGRECVEFYIHVVEATAYTVTYNMQGHGTQIASLQATPNAVMTAPTAPTATGYTFGGWYKDAACTQAWDFDTDKVTTDVTLYAKWTGKSYYVTLNANGGSCSVHNTYLTFGQTCSTLPTPTRSEYTFDGWYDTNDNKFTATTVLNTDFPSTQAGRTLTARWVPAPAAAPTITEGSDLTLNYGYTSGSISVTAAAEPGHTIVGYQWYACDASGANATAINGATSANYAIETGKSIGTYFYYCAVTAKRTSNSETTTAPSAVITVTVDKAALNATVGMNGYTYGGTVSVPSVSGNSENGAVTYYYSTENTTTGGTEWKNIAADTLNAGTYYLYAKIAETTNYAAFTTPAVSFTVAKAAPTVTWPTIAAIYVNDTLTDASLSGGVGAGTFSITGDTTWTTDGSKSTTVTFTPTDTTNYDAATNSNIAVTVNKRAVVSVTTVISAINDKDYGTALGDLGLPTQVDILAGGNKTFTVPVSWSGYDANDLTRQTLTGTLNLSAISAEVTQPETAITATATVTLKRLTASDVTFAEKSATYTGEPISHTIATLPTGVASVTYTYAGTGSTTYAASTTAPTDAGTYTVTAAFTMEAGYAQKDDATAALTINKAAGSVTAPTAAEDLTYNGAAQTLIGAGSSATGEVQYCLGSDGTYGTALPAATNAGTYVVYYKVVGDKNHEDVAADSVSVTIARQPVAIPAADTTEFTYNGEAQTYTVEANALYTVSGNVQTAAGTHPVSVTLNDTLNYKWSDDTDTAQPYNFVIAPAVVTLTVNDKNAYVGSEAPDLSAPVLDTDYTVSGLIGEDALTIAPTLRYDPTTPDMTKAGETTKIVASGASAGDNYTISYVDGKLILSKRSFSGGTLVVTAPVSSDSGSVSVRVDVSKDGTATVDISNKQIERVAADGAGTVTVDVSGMENVESIKVPAHVVETTNTAKDTGLTVALPDGAVAMDETALASVSTGEDVIISVRQIPATELTEEQKKAVGDMANISLVIDVDLLVGGKKQSTFNGGKLTVSVPYTPKAGEDVSKLTIWYIKDDGTIENKGGRYNADTGCFVFETEHLSRYLLVSANISFADVSPDAFYAEAVAWAVAQNITNGIGDDKFGPDLTCTRAEIVTMLWRAAGCPKAKSAADFSDVSAANAFYAEAVAWAVENGITGGVGNGRFAPEDNCTRAQTVAFLYRMEQANGGGFTGAWMFQMPFTDVPEWCSEAAAWCYMNGITQGVGNNQFAPHLDCSRSQIVTMLYRMLGSN